MASAGDTGETDCIRLPCDLPCWREIKDLLVKLSDTKNGDETFDLLLKIHKVKEQDDRIQDLSDTPFRGLRDFYLKHSEQEQCAIVKCMSVIAELASKIEMERPSTGIPYCIQQHNIKVVLDRKLVACLVACCFLCLIPATHKSFLRMPDPNFSIYFDSLFLPSQQAKLQCVLHYFRRVGQSFPIGVIEFTRIALHKKELLTFDSLEVCEKPLCPINIDNEGLIEDSRSKAIHVDFANEYIGGGVLGTGRVQEEILFSICPELISSMIFMECMADNEAICIKGVERFSKHIGYAGRLKFCGDFMDVSDRCADGSMETTICAIDAIPFMFKNGAIEQYEERAFLRELNKAYAGFRQHSSLDIEDQLQNLVVKDESIQKADLSGQNAQQIDATRGKLEQEKRPIATGNWGCGAFGGNPQLKSVIQWLACSCAECPEMAYYTFGARDMTCFRELSMCIKDQKWTVSKLTQVVRSFCSYRRQHEDKELFEYIENVIKKETTV